MLTNSETLKCKTAKDTFERNYRISSFNMAPIIDRMVYAGGAFASILLDEKPRDVDVFILNTQKSDYDIFQKYVDVNSYTIDKKNNDSSASAYKGTNPHIHSVWKVVRNSIDYDLIFTDYQTPEEMISDFDYVHSNVWFYSGRLYLTESTYRSIIDMKLIPASEKPIAPKRKQKFIDRGWKE